MLGGMAIYALLRNVDSLILFRFFPKPGFLEAYPLKLNTGNIFVYIFVFQGPNILWLLTGLFTIRAIWIANRTWMQRYVIVFSVIAAAYELCQISPHFPGTFDILDVVLMCVTAFLESVIYIHFIDRRIK